MDRDDTLIDLGAVTEETKGLAEGVTDGVGGLFIPLGLTDD